MADVQLGAAAGRVQRRDQRFQTARDAAIKSFFDRYGRLPSEDDVEKMVDAFLPLDLQGYRPPVVDNAAVGAHPVRQRMVEPWEAEAVAKAYGQQFGRPPMPEELDRDLGLSLESANGFLGRAPRDRVLSPPGAFERYMLPVFRMLTPTPELPAPGKTFTSTPRG